MANNIKKVAFDGAAVRKELDKRKYHLGDLSHEMGFGDTYVSNALRKNFMSVHGGKVFEMVTNIKLSDYPLFIEKEDPNTIDDIREVNGLLNDTYGINPNDIYGVNGIKANVDGISKEIRDLNDTLRDIYCLFEKAFENDLEFNPDFQQS